MSLIGSCVWTPGPQMLALFGKPAEPVGDGPTLEEVGAGLSVHFRFLSVVAMWPASLARGSPACYHVFSARMTVSQNKSFLPEMTFVRRFLSQQYGGGGDKQTTLDNGKLASSIHSPAAISCSLLKLGWSLINLRCPCWWSTVPSQCCAGLMQTTTAAMIMKAMAGFRPEDRASQHTLPSSSSYVFF